VLADLGLVLFALFYVGVHTAISFRLYDRYLLGLVPLTSIVLARICGLPGWLLGTIRADKVRSILHKVLPALLLLFVVLTVSRPTQIALRYGFPIGGDYLNRYAGIDQVANYIVANAPPGTIVFDKWLGWHYSFHLFDVPVEYAHHETDQDVLETAELYPDREKYVVFPSWTDARELRALLNRNGWELQEAHTTFRADGTVSFTVYRITPSPPV
jgi:hypothetical protein